MKSKTENYPASAAGRDRWIAQRREPKQALNPAEPYAFLWEEEADQSNALIPTATIFLTNRECPFRCLMCDLWQNTLDQSVPRGAIAAQIQFALERLPPARQIKLYNAGSFFDPQAIPPADYAEIAAAVTGFERIIVESHPAFLAGKYSDRVVGFREQIGGQLEVAIGLETVHPGVLDKLNKRMTIASFTEAAHFLRRNRIDLRAFILLKPPFMNEAEGVEWACRSLDVAAECAAGVCSIIPTRGGNGALEALGEAFVPPRLASIEAAVEYGLSLNRFRVFTDLWDLAKFFDCACSPARAARLAHLNQTQQIPEAVFCGECRGA